MSRQLVILFFTILTTTECISNKTAIHVGALIPQLQFRDRFCFGSSIKLAVEKINNSSFILPDHHIILHLKETHGRVGFALESLYQLLYTKPTKVAILGPGFSAPSKAVAELCTVFGTLQVSYSAIDPSLMSQLQYPFFFRSTPSIQSFNKVKISFFKHFGWKRVAVLYDYTDNLFFQTTDHLSKMLIANNFTNLMISGFDDDVHTRMDKLQERNARIIVGEFSKKGARKVFCEAYKRKMYGSKYVWMIMQGLSDTWFEDANDIDCNSTQLLIASEGYFRATRSNLRQDNIKTLFGKTGEEIWEEIKAKKISDYYPSKTTLSSADVHPGATFAFDATVALVEALHKAEIGGIVDFETYDYKNYETTFAIGQLLLGTTLEGVTGSMKYDMATRERLGEVEIQQFRKGKYCTVARHYTASDVLVFDPINSKKMFPDDVIPRDHPVIVREAILYSLSLVSGLWAISWLGFLLALVFLFVNIKYSNIKVIKMSSPKINNIICFGCMLCYVAVVLYGLDSRMIDVHYIPLTCNSIAIMLSVGFTLAFGGLFSKTFRVYRVFTASKNLTRVSIKDSKLFGLIVVLILIDILVFVTWMIVSPFQLALQDLDEIEDKSRDVVTIHYIHKCKCQYQMYFFASMYGYKGLLVIFGLFLAWETRNVHLAVLNDSKYIGMAVYNVCVLGTLGIVIETAIDDKKNHVLGYVVVALCVFLATTTTLLLIFVPKVKMLFCEDPEEAVRKPTFKFASNVVTSLSTLGTTPLSVSSFSVVSTSSVQSKNITPRDGNKENTSSGMGRMAGYVTNGERKISENESSEMRRASDNASSGMRKVSENVSSGASLCTQVSAIVNANVYVGPVTN